MRNFEKTVLGAIVLLIALSGWAQGPQRKVERNVIRSERDPAVTIRLPQSITYAGADRWTLYGVADCEVHAFVETDPRQSVKALYWVQFEGYIPSKPDARYDYDSPRHANLGGLDFFVDTWVRADGESSRAGSDREHVEALIKSKGLKMPANMAYVRLVHLVEADKRRELMIIYGEDLASTGFTAADLGKGGKAHDKWPAIEQRVMENAKKTLEITVPGSSHNGSSGK